MSPGLLGLEEPREGRVALIDLLARVVRARIVYYGPAFGGKTTNLRKIEARVSQSARGDLASLAGDDDRTLFLDDLALDLGDVGGWRVRVDLSSVPGQPRFARTRVAVLQGADGVVFVADSAPARQEANIESFIELGRNLAAAGHDPARFPLVLQANKRDAPDPVPLGELRRALGATDRPLVSSVATDGEGVFEALRAACKLVAAAL